MGTDAAENLWADWDPAAVSDDDMEGDMDGDDGECDDDGQNSDINGDNKDIESLFIP